MSQPTKRVAVSSVNWAKLAERLTPAQEAELSKLKLQNSNFHAEIVQLQADPPKVDWTALKKQMPESSAALDALQKQWGSLSIPYGSVPEPLSKQVDQWIQYNEARTKFHAQKSADGEEEAKKIDAKWAKCPPVEHMQPDQFVQYFGGDKKFALFRRHMDFRYEVDEFHDVWGTGVNERGTYKERFADYRVGRRPGAAGH